MSVDIIRELAIGDWKPQLDENREVFARSLESGNVLFFPKLEFCLLDTEKKFLSDQWSDGKSKNISIRGDNAELKGARGGIEDLEVLRLMLQRFRNSANSLVSILFPSYESGLMAGFTSYRTISVEQRVTSWRKDDTRLHVDAFPSNPTRGLRLLRVFANVNPVGKPRLWRVGEPFEDHARRFLPKLSPPLPGSAWLLDTLGLTKSRRTDYDHYMNQLHDFGKADADFQKNSPQVSFGFPPGCSWVVFSDQVLHAVMSGQFMLEQTFYLDPDYLIDPESGPLKVLERLTGRKLIAAA